MRLGRRSAIIPGSEVLSPEVAQLILSLRSTDHGCMSHSHDCPSKPLIREITSGSPPELAECHCNTEKTDHSYRKSQTPNSDYKNVILPKDYSFHLNHRYSYRPSLLIHKSYNKKLYARSSNDKIRASHANGYCKKCSPEASTNILHMSEIRSDDDINSAGDVSAAQGVNCTLHKVSSYIMIV